MGQKSINYIYHYLLIYYHRRHRQEDLKQKMELYDNSIMNLGSCTGNIVYGKKVVINHVVDQILTIG